MNRNVRRLSMMRVLMAAALTSMAASAVSAQQPARSADRQAAAARAQHDQKVRQIEADKAGYVLAIVFKWEADARMLGRWNETYATDLQRALMRLDVENLLAAGEASSYKDMMQVLAAGRVEPTVQPDLIGDPPTTDALGDAAADLVYTPVAPCRLADTRFGGGAITGNSSRSFDSDGSNLAAQGGSASGCGIPFGAARAIAVTITVTEPWTAGYLTAWAGGTRPTISALNYAASQTIANTTIVPVIPGAGNDFEVYSFATAQVIMDVVGYFAAPVATALDCTTSTSAVTAAANNVWTAIDAVCPSGRTATGGGYNTPEGTLGYPGVWLTSLPGAAYGFNGWRVWVDNQTGGSRSIQTFVVCCRVPGR
jgi:hypothetical protein